METPLYDRFIKELEDIDPNLTYLYEKSIEDPSYAIRVDTGSSIHLRDDILPNHKILCEVTPLLDHKPITDINGPKKGTTHPIDIGAAVSFVEGYAALENKLVPPKNIKK